MADVYANYAALAAANVEGVDYLRIVQPTSITATTHIAIHGGAIESGTGEMAKAVSARLGHSMYVFQGMKSSGNTALHITSTHFDEPMCVAMQAKATRTVSYHGAEGGADDGTQLLTYIGGLDTTLKTNIANALTAAGFSVDLNPSSTIAGVDPDNICNRNKSGAGVQLEITTALRNSFFPGGTNNAAARNDFSKRTDTFYAYCDAVVSAVGLEAKYNTVNVWDGTKWVASNAQAYTGSRWRTNPALYWDGSTWATSKT
ncbi:poly-gamma-glutamate hydrolase family protein [Streptomyces sp. NPDC029080]|uniref:poly-gamma-glutamate hydrolase family protein n=1 Tax=Streptomyces sp. NPDC029080 TaxID=3155017 RepID=UPI0033ECAA2F